MKNSKTDDAFDTVEDEMKNKDFCKYVDVFYGNGEVDHFPEEGLASKWFYIKALCGNTTPHAVLPFGRISVGAYSGGYPTGYGNHYPNGCGGIKKLGETNKIRGFSHIHQSGVGGIRYYYNYAIVTPFYGEISEVANYYELKKEYAVPGYYSAEMNDVSCEMTVNKNCAFHRYTFKKSGGRVAVDFSNDGLHRLFGEVAYGSVKDAEIKTDARGKVYFSGKFSGIKLFFCALAEGENVKSKLAADGAETEVLYDKTPVTKEFFGAVFDFDGDEINIKLSYSTISYEAAEKNICQASDDTFEETKEKAYSVWNEYLSQIEIETDDRELKEKFYSNFYHSIIKPVDMTGEEVMGIKDDLVVDFATFWDQYKTVLPLIFMLYDDMSEKIVAAIVNISRTLGKIPCSLGMSDVFPCEEQAKMLGIFVLCDAYYSGIKNANKAVVDECIKRELERDDFVSFLETGFFERYTHILDVTDACLDVAAITEDEELKKRLLDLAENWVKAYDKKDGLMSEASPYYEGDRYTYSFRLQKNMKDRIALAGGNEKFVEMLDSFFGFGKESVKQITDIDAYKEISESKHRRFEGFNNECDMETPYAYVYAGRHDRTCDIIRACVRQSFTTGKGGLPGNNDSGGLSSCFLWNVLGLFPVSGTGEFVLGIPQINRAAVSLSNGNKLRILADGLNAEDKYVKCIEFNGKVVEDFRIHTEELMLGGNLVFHIG